MSSFLQPLTLNRQRVCVFSHPGSSVVSLLSCSAEILFAYDLWKSHLPSHLSLRPKPLSQTYHIICGLLVYLYIYRTVLPPASEVGMESVSPTWVARSKVLNHHLHPSQVHWQQMSWNQNSQDFNLISMWDAGNHEPQCPWLIHLTFSLSTLLWPALRRILINCQLLTAPLANHLKTFSLLTAYFCHDSRVLQIPSCFCLDFNASHFFSSYQFNSCRFFFPSPCVVSRFRAFVWYKFLNLPLGCLKQLHKPTENGATSDKLILC